MKFTLRDIIILVGALITIWGMQKGFNLWLIKNHNSIDFERLQIVWSFILSIACSASIGFSYVLWKKYSNIKTDIPEIVKKEIKSEIGIIIGTVSSLEKMHIATLQIHASSGGDTVRADIASKVLREIGIK